MFFNFKKGLLTMNNEITFNDYSCSLPDETVFNVFTYLSAKDLAIVSFACKQFYHIANDSLLWKNLVDKKFNANYQNVLQENKNPHWKEVYIQAALKITLHQKPQIKTLSIRVSNLKLGKKQMLVKGIEDGICWDFKEKATKIKDPSWSTHVNWLILQDKLVIVSLERSNSKSLKIQTFLSDHLSPPAPYFHPLHTSLPLSNVKCIGSGNFLGCLTSITTELYNHSNIFHALEIFNLSKNNIKHQSLCCFPYVQPDNHRINFQIHDNFIALWIDNAYKNENLLQTESLFSKWIASTRELQELCDLELETIKESREIASSSLKNILEITKKFQKEAISSSLGKQIFSDNQAVEQLKILTTILEVLVKNLKSPPEFLNLSSYIEQTRSNFTEKFSQLNKYLCYWDEIRQTLFTDWTNLTNELREFNDIDSTIIKNNYHKKSASNSLKDIITKMRTFQKEVISSSMGKQIIRDNHATKQLKNLLIIIEEFLSQIKAPPQSLDLFSYFLEIMPKFTEKFNMLFDQLNKYISNWIYANSVILLEIDKLDHSSNELIPKVGMLMDFGHNDTLGSHLNNQSVVTSLAFSAEECIVNFSNGPFGIWDILKRDWKTIKTNTVAFTTLKADHRFVIGGNDKVIYFFDRRLLTPLTKISLIANASWDYFSKKFVMASQEHDKKVEIRDFSEKKID